MVKKRLRTFLIAILVCCLVGTFYYTQKPVVLTIGVFAGSNWNVPSPDSGKIIDNVIKRFEKTHPNVQVKYVSGILKDDYSAWLSKEALDGKLPDVFMVLSDDLSTYAKVGMLESLDTYMQTDPILINRDIFQRHSMQVIFMISSMHFLMRVHPH